MDTVLHTQPGHHTFFRRVVSAARLDPWIYREVEFGGAAFFQSVLVVVMASAGVWIGITGHVRPLPLLLLACAAGLAAWIVWSGLAFAIGVMLFGAPENKTTWWHLLHTTGFATAPGILAAFGLFPALTGMAAFAANIWIFEAFVVAVQRALEYKTWWQAVSVCAIGWAIYWGTIWAVR